MQTWEGAYSRSWDVLQEDEDEGGLQSTVEKLLARGRRKRRVLPLAPFTLHMDLELKVCPELRQWRVLCGGLSSDTCSSSSIYPSPCATRTSVLPGQLATLPDLGGELIESRWEVTLQYLRGYIGEWFDQNPLGQVGIVLLRDRLSETLIPMGGARPVLRYDT